LSLFFGRIAAAVRSGLGLDGVLDLGSKGGGAVRRDLELLFGVRENPLAAISYCFCNFR
jgi:hypothetical protein